MRAQKIQVWPFKNAQRSQDYQGGTPYSNDDNQQPTIMISQNQQCWFKVCTRPSKSGMEPKNNHIQLENHLPNPEMEVCKSWGYHFFGWFSIIKHPFYWGSSIGGKPHRNLLLEGTVPELWCSKPYPSAASKKVRSFASKKTIWHLTFIECVDAPDIHLNLSVFHVFCNWHTFLLTSHFWEPLLFVQSKAGQVWKCAYLHWSSPSMD